MLLKWATERADGAFLPIYLEATNKGRPLYEKFGFENLGLLETGMEKYGGSGNGLRWLMIRKPQSKQVN